MGDFCQGDVALSLIFNMSTNVINRNSVKRCTVCLSNKLFSSFLEQVWSHLL